MVLMDKGMGERTRVRSPDVCGWGVWHFAPGVPCAAASALYTLTNAASGLGVAALSDTGTESVDSTESYSSDRGIGQCTERVQMAETGVKGRHG